MADAPCLTGGGRVGRRTGAGRPPAVDRGAGWTGTEFEVTVGPVAHGGHCVARHEGRVVFVRHTLPGERVVVAGHRGPPPRLLPGRRRRGPRRRARAGGAAVPAQRPGPLRRLRLAARDARRPAARSRRRWSASSWPGWPARRRRRDRRGAARRPAALAVAGALRRRPVRRRPGCAGTARTTWYVLDDCPITVEPAARAVLGARWPGAGAVDVSVDSTGAVTTTRLDRRGRPLTTRHAGRRGVPVEPAARAERHAGGRDWEVEGTGFWQVHPAAADALVAAVDRLRPGAAGGDGARPLRRVPGCSAARSPPRSARRAAWSASSPMPRPAPPPTPTWPTCPRPRSGRARSTPRGWSGLLDELGRRPRTSSSSTRRAPAPAPR